MTIKEIEQRSGMSRANVRFYETEGLLSPQRDSNGYRNYTEDDLKILQRIQLFRMLHIPIEDIRAMQKNEQSLSAVMELRLQELREQTLQTDSEREMCERLRREGATYEALNAGFYLEVLQGRAPEISFSGQKLLEENQSARVAASSSTETNDGMSAQTTVSDGFTNRWGEVIERDSIPRVHDPWRRYGARILDCVVYEGLVMFVVSRMQYVGIGDGGLVTWFVLFASTLLILFVEPLLLRVFGTTPGKWILGLYVRSEDGRKLSYSEGLMRTWQVLFYGMGLRIPIISLICMVVSFRRCRADESLTWEFDSELLRKDDKKWRIAVFLVMYVMIFAIAQIVPLIPPAPAHRGRLTVEQYCDNYNQYMEYYQFSTDYQLDRQGRWEKKPQSGGTFTVIVSDEMVSQAMPEYTFVEQGEDIREVAFTVTPGSKMVPDQRERIHLAMLSYVLADRSGWDYLKAWYEVEKVYRYMNKYQFQSFDFTVGGVEVSCEYGVDDRREGSIVDFVYAWMYQPAENEDFQIRFTMRR